MILNTETLMNERTFGFLFFPVLSSILLGVAVIYLFNRIPARWLCEYGEAPSSELLELRIKTLPWIPASVLFFVLASVKLSLDSPLNLPPLPLFSKIICWSDISLQLLIIFLLLHILIADCKYMIIPDQHLILIAIAAALRIVVNITYVMAGELVPLTEQLLHHLKGGAVGAGTIFLIALAGAILLKKETIGFGDLKLMAVAGFSAGTPGAVLIFLMAAFSSGILFSILLLFKKIKADDGKPLGPFIAAAAAVFMLFDDELTNFMGGGFC